MSIFNMTSAEKQAGEIGLLAGILGTEVVSAIAGGSADSGVANTANGAAASKKFPWLWVAIPVGLILIGIVIWAIFFR